MNVWKIFDTIEEAVASSQRLPPPFSQWSLMNRHNFMRLMDKMRSSVSPELKQARAISKDVQRLLAEAQDQADLLLREAEEKAKKASDTARTERETLVNATEVVALARKRAEEIEAAAQKASEELEAETRHRCQELRKQAEEYAHEVRRKAEQDARVHEAELERYAVKLLSSMEHEIGRALQVVKAHRLGVEGRPTQAAAQEDEDTLTLEPVKVKKVVAVAAQVAAAGGRRTA